MDIIAIVIFVFMTVAFISARIEVSKSEEYTEYIYKNGIIYDADGVRVGIYFKRMMVLNGKTIDFSSLNSTDFKTIKSLVESGGYDENGGD